MHSATYERDEDDFVIVKCDDCLAKFADWIDELEAELRNQAANRAPRHPDDTSSMESAIPEV